MAKCIIPGNVEIYDIDASFKKNGYIELPSNGYELMFNGCEIKDQALFGYFYNKIKALLQKIQK